MTSHDDTSKVASQSRSPSPSSARDQSKMIQGKIDVALLIVAAQLAQKRQRLLRLAARLTFLAIFSASTVLVRRFGELAALHEAVEQQFCGNSDTCPPVQAPDEIKPWLQQVIVPAVFWQEQVATQAFHATECKLAAQNLTDAPAPEVCSAVYVRGGLRIVSPVRFRQVVVKESRCNPNAAPCWPSFAAGEVRKSGLCTQVQQHPCHFREDLPALAGYGGNSFVLDLIAGNHTSLLAWRENFDSATQFAKGEAPWLSQGLRAFSAEFVLLARPREMVTLVRFLFEVTAGGRVQPSLQTWSLQATPYDNAVSVLADVMLLIALGVYTCAVLHSICRQRLFFVLQLQRLPELVNLLLHLWAALRWMLYLAEDRSGLLFDVSKDKDGFPDLERLISLSDGASQIAAINISFACLAILRDLQAVRTFSVVGAALNDILSTLLLPAFGLITASAGFVVCGHWLLGSQAAGFSSISTAVATVLSGPYGVVDYPRLVGIMPQAVSLYVSIWVMFMLLVVAGFLTSVVIEATENVQAEDPRRREALLAAEKKTKSIATPAKTSDCISALRVPPWRAVANSSIAWMVSFSSGVLPWGKKMKAEQPLEENAQLLLVLLRVGAHLIADEVALASLDERLGAGFDQISPQALAELLGRCSGGCRRQPDVANADLQSLASACGNPAHGQLGATQDAATPAADGNTTEGFMPTVSRDDAHPNGPEVGWSREVDEDVMETLNMLRFEILSLSEVLAGQEVGTDDCKCRTYFGDIQDGFATPQRMKQPPLQDQEQPTWPDGRMNELREELITARVFESRMPTDLQSASSPPRDALQDGSEQLPELPPTDWQEAFSEWQGWGSHVSERVPSTTNEVAAESLADPFGAKVLPACDTPISSGPTSVPVSTNPIESGPQDVATEAATTEYEIITLPNGRLRI